MSSRECESTANRNTLAAPVLIAAVAACSPAAGGGIEAGDRLAAIGGAPARDYVDYKFLSADERVAVEVIKPDGARRVVVIEKHPDEDLGLDFLTDLFDGMRRCRNRCVFCFYDQLPRGLRPTLYLRDDDFRLSFLHGNFVTLTNLGEEDFARIREQRLSPLYISVHATDPDLRRRLLGNPRAPEVLAQMRRLAQAGIELHAQVVLCPGLNDGAALERTVADLAALHPALGSIALVPVGLTMRREGLFELRPVTGEDAREILDRVRAWQDEFLSLLGSRLVFATDEIYALADVEFPPAEDYQGFPQRDNGIGLARLFLDEWEGTDFRPAAGLSVTMVTGGSARGLVERMAARMSVHGARAQVVAVTNRLFGETITVAGLLAGADAADALAGRELGDVIALPSSALREHEFLDSLTLEELSRRLGKKVIHAAGPRELARKLARRRRPATTSGACPKRAAP
jgi:putative radical SAM enzyme (TIGR03279 family)